jgi:group I intron endonuclease
MKTGVIYKIENPTGKLYIGKAVSFTSRMWAYKNLKCKQQRALYASLVKYGFDAHKVEIIFEGPVELLAEKEINYIKKYNSFSGVNPNGLNLTLGGEGTLGVVHSSEAIEKRRQAHIGKKRTQETRNKMSQAAKGKSKNLSVEQVEKKQAQMKGNKHGAGKKKTATEIQNWKDSLKESRQKQKGTIQQISISGDLIKEWAPSYVEIAKALGCDPTTIRVATLSNMTKTAVGFKWQFNKNE